MAIHSLQLDSICGKFCEGPAGRIVVPWNKTSLVSFVLRKLSWKGFEIDHLRNSREAHVKISLFKWQKLVQVVRDKNKCTIKVPINENFPSVIKVAMFGIYQESFESWKGHYWFQPRLTRQLFSDRLWREDRKPAFSLRHCLGKIGVILILIRNMVHQNNYQLLHNDISVLQPKLWDAAKIPWGSNCANRCCVQQKQTSNGRCLWFGDKRDKALGAFVWVQSWQIFLLQQI